MEFQIDLYAKPSDLRQIKTTGMTKEEDLIRQGWQRQNTTDEPRLSELVQMYEEIGFEVHVEPFHPEEEPGCAECLKADPARYQTIYTRRKEQ